MKMEKIVEEKKIVRHWIEESDLLPVFAQYAGQKNKASKGVAWHCDFRTSIGFGLPMVASC